jgi:hypothetical protein
MILAACLLALAQTQTVHLPSEQSPAVYSGAILQSPTPPSSVTIELDGRNLWSFCATNNSNLPATESFTEGQALRIIVGALSINGTGDLAQTRLIVQPGATECDGDGAIFSTSLVFTDPSIVAIFTGAGSLPVRVEWDTSPEFHGNGNVMTVQTATFSGRLNFIYQ